MKMFLCAVNNMLGNILDARTASPTSDSLPAAPTSDYLLALSVHTLYRLSHCLSHSCRTHPHFLKVCCEREAKLRRQIKFWHSATSCRCRSSASRKDLSYSLVLCVPSSSPFHFAVSSLSLMICRLCCHSNTLTICVSSDSAPWEGWSQCRTNRDRMTCTLTGGRRI